MFGKTLNMALSKIKARAKWTMGFTRIRVHMKWIMNFMEIKAHVTPNMSFIRIGWDKGSYEMNYQFYWKTHYIEPTLHKRASI